MKPFYCLTFCFIYFFTSQGQTADISSALKNYQDGNFTEAKNQLEQALEQNKSDSYLLYNLGLVEYKLGNVGHALGKWNRALNITPSLKEARLAIDFALSKMQIPPEKPEAEGFIDIVRYDALRYIPFHFLQILTLVVLLFFWRRFLYEFKKRQAEEKENSLKTAYTIPTILTLILLLTLLFFDALKIYEHSLHKAIVVQKSDGRTGPSNDQVSLFEINEGTEVVIKEYQNEWYKISTPHDKLGWVPKESLYLTTD